MKAEGEAMKAEREEMKAEGEVMKAEGEAMKKDDSTLEHQSIITRVFSDLRIAMNRVTLPLQNNSAFPDLGLRSTLFGAESAFLETFPPYEEEKVKIWMMRDAFHCHYFVFYVPGGSQVRIIGPYQIEDMSFADMHRRLEKIGMGNANLSFLSQYYHVVPHIRDESLLYSIIRNHCIEIFGPEGFEIAYWQMEFVSRPKAPEQTSTDTGYHRDIIEDIYLEEKRMMECITLGNFAGAMAAIRKMEPQGIEQRTNSTLRDLKNYSIVLATLCRVAAREGGVTPWDLNTYSREVSIEIENATSSRELRNIRGAMLKRYCELVRSSSRSEYSPLVEEMVSYMRANFSRDITLQETGEALHKSPSYLSARFKKETGKTFSMYLTDLRLGYAKELLLSTDLSVGSIAERCGIPDHNYFARLFKSRENKSPKQYREEGE